jgi:hypothetical protein
MNRGKKQPVQNDGQDHFEPVFYVLLKSFGRSFII